MTVTPLVSIVMPVYNSEAYLRLAVESILNQTFSYFEFIIIDDGSTDRTAAILDGYTDPRIICLYNQEYRGLVHSLNRGIDAARGKYIARMDADDISLPRRLERQVHYMEAYPSIGLLGTWIEDLDENGNLIGVWGAPTTPALIKWSLLFGNCLAHPSVVMRRSMIQRVGSYNAEALYAEDYDLWSRMSFETEIANLPEVLVRHRVHSGSISLRYSERQERTVVQVARSAISRVLGEDISMDQVVYLRRAVRGLPLYATDQIRSVALLIQQLYQSYNAQFSSSASERRQVSMDAAEKMLNLFLRNFARWPKESLATFFRAVILDPRVLSHRLFIRLIPFLKTSLIHRYFAGKIRALVFLY